MALTRGNTSSGENFGQSSLTVSHTVASGDNRILVVTVDTFRSAGGRAVTSVTYGGVALTKAVDAFSSFSGHEYVSIWYLLNPTVGTANIVATCGAGTVEVMGVGGVDYSDAMQSGQPDATASVSRVDVTNGTINITTVADNASIVSVSQMGQTGDQTVSSPQTQFHETDGGYVVSSYSNAHTPAGSKTHTYSSPSGANNKDFVIAAMSIAPFVEASTPVEVTPDAQAVVVDSPTVTVSAHRAVSVSADAQLIYVTNPSATVSTTRSTTAQASAQELVASSPPVSVQAQRQASAASEAQAITVVSPPASVSADRHVTVSAPTQGISVSSPAVNVTTTSAGGASVDASVISVSSPAASVSTTQISSTTAPANEIIVVSPPTTVSATRTVSVLVDVQGLVIDNPPASVAGEASTIVSTEVNEVQVGNPSVSVQTQRAAHLTAQESRISVVSPPVTVRGSASTQVQGDPILVTSPAVGVRGGALVSSTALSLIIGNPAVVVVISDGRYQQGQPRSHWAGNRANQSPTARYNQR